MPEAYSIKDEVEKFKSSEQRPLDYMRMILHSSISLYNGTSWNDALDEIYDAFGEPRLGSSIERNEEIET
jgi:hypothetical protein